MLEKTMKQVLTKKINDWVSTIDDEDVVKAIKDDLVITGGCFTSMIMNETPNDFDCYFKTKESVLKVANYYVDLWRKTHKNRECYVLDCDNPRDHSEMVKKLDKGRVKIVIPSSGVSGDPDEVRASEELGVEDVKELTEDAVNEILEKEKKKYFPVFLSSNAITLSDGIQIVVRFFGEPNQVHDTFDFVHTKAYYTKDGVVVPKEVYEAVINKTLIYTGSKYPVCSLFRLRKFIARGWTINAGQILKMAMQISELDLLDIDVLSENLVGVDSLYFLNLIHQFRNQQGNPDFNLTTQYVISVIDKIF